MRKQNKPELVPERRRPPMSEKCKNCGHPIFRINGKWVHEKGFIPNRKACAEPLSDYKNENEHGYCGCTSPEPKKERDEK